MFKLIIFNNEGHSCTYNSYKTYEEAKSVAEQLQFWSYRIEEVK